MKFTDQSVNVIALGSLEAQAGRSMDGLIGRDVFTRYVVEIDYLGKVVSLYDLMPSRRSDDDHIFVRNRSTCQSANRIILKLH
ncbi:MAG TPA: hypothetical protein VKC61_24295 [Pyrinomonadaceae bacterium]|nr:hypothetical protein [Pyrinomonadaceae bacterium]